MKDSGFDLFRWLTGYGSWTFYCALISTFGMAGFFSDLWRGRIPDWLGVGVLMAPICILLFAPWGEGSKRIVARLHLVAALWFLALAIGMEVVSAMGFNPRGTTAYRMMVHAGWSVAWAGILTRAWRAHRRNEMAKTASAPNPN